MTFFVLSCRVGGIECRDRNDDHGNHPLRVMYFNKVKMTYTWVKINKCVLLSSCRRRLSSSIIAMCTLLLVNSFNDNEECGVIMMI